jgi:hypothetical protein
LTVALADVKRLAGVTGTADDTEIQALIDLFSPVLEAGLEGEALSSSADTVSLGAAEVVAGEWLARQGRVPGARDEVRAFGFLLKPAVGDPGDPSGLIARGSARLRPFLGPAVSLGSGGVLLGPEVEEAEPAEEGW